MGICIGEATCGLGGARMCLGICRMHQGTLHGAACLHAAACHRHPPNAPSHRPLPLLPYPLPRLQYISVLTGTTSGVAIQQVVQLGMFSIITYAVELLLEYGFMKMIGTIVMQIIQGGWAGRAGGLVGRLSG